MKTFCSWLSEGIGTAEYRPPQDVKQLLLDFSSLNLLTGEQLGLNTPLDKDLKFNIQQAYSTLIPYLKSHLLQKVAYSVFSEIRHFPGWNQVMRGVHWSSERPEDYENWVYGALEDLDPYVNWDGNDVESMKKPTPPPGDLPEMMENLKKLFLLHVWKHNYGGKPWADACDAWLKLNAARTPREISVWIDHIYDLQHNTGSLLNKNREYAGKHPWEQSWVQAALSVKRDAKSLMSILRHASPFVQNLGRRVLYATEMRGRKLGGLFKYNPYGQQKESDPFDDYDSDSIEDDDLLGMEPVPVQPVRLQPIQSNQPKHPVGKKLINWLKSRGKLSQ